MNTNSLKVDPRTKILFFVVFFLLSFISTDIPLMLLLSLSLLFLAYVERKLWKVLSGLKIMLPLIIVAFILWSFFYSFSLFYHSTTTENFQFGLFMSLRLFLIILISLTFVSTITPREIVSSLESFGVPYKVAFVLGLSIRHISTVSDDYISIKEAQASRGLELEKGFLIRRIKNHIPLLIPLLIRSIEKAENLVLAMELKSFSFQRRTYKKNKMSYLDYFFSVILLSLAIISILHYVFRVV